MSQGAAPAYACSNLALVGMLDMNSIRRRAYSPHTRRTSCRHLGRCSYWSRRRIKMEEGCKRQSVRRQAPGGLEQMFFEIGNPVAKRLRLRRRQQRLKPRSSRDRFPVRDRDQIARALNGPKSALMRLRHAVGY